MPLVGNTHELQTQRHETGRWFVSTAGAINPRVKDGATSQGFYVIGADGKGYVFNNNRSVERVLGVLGEGLRQFRKNPPAKVDVADAVDPRPTPPPGTTVLRLYSRIRPVPLGADTSNENLQRDHLWILPDEASSLVELRMPDALARRMCRYALVDAIRGEPDFWKPDEVKVASFKLAKTRSGVKLAGVYAMATRDGKRGLEGAIEAEIDFDGVRIRRFEGLAKATAWGAGTYTPNPPAGKFPMVFAFIVAADAIDTVAPQAAMYGGEYLKP